ncbi:MAG: hypothetical protein J0I65_25960 [Variovorax sp.]|nr:hypothetical protein [Variovorax sp.]
MKLSKAPPFEARFRPGQAAPVTGIYQCVGCGFEIVRVVTRLLQSRGDPGLPRHPREWPQMSWRLLAQTEQKPKPIPATAAHNSNSLPKTRRISLPCNTQLGHLHNQHHDSAD